MKIEIGKRYNMRGGGTATITNQINDVCLKGITHDDIDLAWREDGSWSLTQGERHHKDLISEVIPPTTQGHPMKIEAGKTYIMRNGEELWRAVVGFEGLYEVSNFGRVKSLQRKKHNHGKMQDVPERVLVPAQTNYPSVSLWKEGALKVKKVHRVVAEAWLENPLQKLEVNHIDADRNNNQVGNLEWATRKENCAHAKDNGLVPKGENHVNTKVSTDAVLAYAKHTAKVTQRQVASYFGISQSRVSQILKQGA